MHRLARRLHRKRLLICCYHGLRDDEDPGRHWLLLPRREFARQLRYLHSRYRCVPIDQAIEELRSGALPANTACVTFDDGYRTNLTIGLPLLEQFEIPAAIYLTTGLIATDELLWNTELELAIWNTPEGSIDLSELGLGVRSLEDAQSRREIATQACGVLKQRPYEERKRLTAQLHESLRSQSDSSQRDAFTLLSWSEVSEMEATGLIRFGGHTRYHDILSRLDDQTVESEVETSIRDVVSRLESASRTFAYPNGTLADFDERAREAVRDMGCTAALTSVAGLCGTETDLYSLPRVVVGAEMTFDEFRLSAAGVPDLIERWTTALGRLRKRTPTTGTSPLGA